MYFKNIFYLKDKIRIRKIIADDDAKLSFIIRNSLEEFGAAKPGTVHFDETTDHLYDVFQTEISAYFVIEINTEVWGGAGISFPFRVSLRALCAAGHGYSRVIDL